MADVTYVATMVNKIEASERLGPDFVRRCTVRVYVDGRGCTHHLYRAAHIERSTHWYYLTLAQLRASDTLCTVCWQSARLEKKIFTRWSRSISPDTGIDLVGDAYALAELLERIDDVSASLAQGSLKAQLVRQITSIEREVSRVHRRHDHPLLGPLVAQLPEMIDKLKATAAGICSTRAIESWALDLLGDPTGIDVDCTPTVLALSRVLLAGRSSDMAALAIDHYQVGHLASKARVLVAPRFVVDALLVASQEYFDGKLSTRACADPVEVVETAAGLWDPGSCGPLASFSEALNVARSLLAPNLANAPSEAPSR